MISTTIFEVYFFHHLESKIYCGSHGAKSKITRNSVGKSQQVDIKSVSTLISLITRPDLRLDAILALPFCPLKAEHPGDDPVWYLRVLSIDPGDYGGAAHLAHVASRRCVDPVSPRVDVTRWLGRNVGSGLALKSVPSDLQPLATNRIITMVISTCVARTVSDNLPPFILQRRVITTRYWKYNHNITLYRFRITYYSWCYFLANSEHSNLWTWRFVCYDFQKFCIEF